MILTHWLRRHAHAARERAIKKHLSGSVVVVTGSSRGIGRETALLLARCGAIVVINGRDATRLEATREALMRRVPHARIKAIACDIATEDGARELVTYTHSQFGRLDHLINNAGVSMRGKIADLKQEAVDRIVNANVRAAVLPTVAALPSLRANGGHVVFVSTVAAMCGFAGVSLYSAAKSAVEIFQQALEREEYTAGVRSSIVFLGFVENDPDKYTIAADGSAFHHQRRAMQTQSEAAEWIAYALTSPRRRIITVWQGRILALALRIAPGVVHRVLRGSGRSIHHVSRS